MKLISALLLAALALHNLALGQYTEKDFLTGTRQLVFEGKRSGEGYFSADGQWLVFQSEREAENPFYQIYTLNLETGETRRVSPGYGKTTCSWFHPQGTQVMFGSTHLDPKAREKMQAELDFRATGKKRRYAWDYDETFDIFACNPDGSGCRQLTTALGYDAEGAYSPDGKYIVFSSMRDAYNRTLSAEDQKMLEIDPSYFGEVYIMNADGSNQRRLTNWDGYDGGTFFSPDGQRIIWRHFDPTGKTADVYTMKLDGTDRQRVTDFASMSWAPIFHPSQQYIIFTTNKNGFSNFELYIVDAKGEKEPVRITYTDGFDGLPMFSPDGNSLSWTSGRTAGGDSQIFLAGWNHQRALEALAAAPARSTAPAPASPVQRPTGLLVPPGPKAGSKETVREEDLKAHLSYLASDELEGRLTGSPGAQKAASYLKEKLLALPGIKTFEGGALAAFPFTKKIGLNPGTSHFNIIGVNKKLNKTLTPGTDYAPYTASGSGKTVAGVAFAGYGIKTAEGAENPVNAYGTLSADAWKGKIVLAMEGLPDGLPQDERQRLAPLASLERKAVTAKSMGATALILVSRKPALGLAPDAASGDYGATGLDLPVLRISWKAFEELAKTADLADLPAQLADRSAKDGVILTGLDSWSSLQWAAAKPVQADLNIEVLREKGEDNNVVAYLPATAPGAKPQYLLVCAHYDHLGRGQVNSMARAGEEGQIHNGADDNASGSATVLELAEYFAATYADPAFKTQYSLIFALWSGEEMGLLGSSYWTSHPPVPIDQIAAAMNFDMVGRVKDNKLSVQGAGSSSVWPKLAERANIKAGFDLSVQNDPYVPTDGASLYTHGVPTLNWFSGLHEDYHRPVDDENKINYPDMKRVGDMAARMLTMLLANPERPDYLKVEAPGSQTRRTSGSASLGTIPDYAAEAKGVKLSGVRGGGAAEKAGLKGGDIIVGLAGKPIANIHEYVAALDLLVPGKPVPIIVQRDGKEITLEITPQAK